MRTKALRPLCAPAASGSCSDGTTARTAPGRAALNTVLPAPSTKPMPTMTQKGVSTSRSMSANVASAAARAASAQTIRARRLQWSAATPAGMASAAVGTARANETTPALAAECVRASTRSG